MTATGRGTERREGDRYMTPEPLALTLCNLLRPEVGSLTGCWIWEPACGHGSFVAAARATWPLALVSANDPVLAPGALPNAHEAAAATMEQVVFGGRWKAHRPRLIIGNPPFSLAEKHVRLGLSQLARRDGTLAFLMRTNLLGSISRVGFWREHRPAWIAPIVPRPSFTGTGTDSTEYALFVWVSGRRRVRRQTLLREPIVWKLVREPT